MSATQGNVLVLIAFAALLVGINIKSGGRTWSGRILKWGTYVLLIFTLAETTYLIDGLVR